MSGRPPRGQEKTPPDEEWPALLKAHGSYGALARLFDVSRSTVSQRCRRLGLPSPDQRLGLRHCAVCGVSSENGSILRFQLHASRAFPGKPKGGYAGSINLCRVCWSAKRNKRSALRS